MGWMMGLEEADTAAGGVKNMPVACFLGRGRVLFFPGASGTDGNGKKTSLFLIHGLKHPYAVDIPPSTHYNDSRSIWEVYFCEADHF